MNLSILLKNERRYWKREVSSTRLCHLRTTLSDWLSIWLLILPIHILKDYLSSTLKLVSKLIDIIANSYVQTFKTTICQTCRMYLCVTTLIHIGNTRTRYKTLFVYSFNTCFYKSINMLISVCTLLLYLGNCVFRARALLFYYQMIGSFVNIYFRIKCKWDMVETKR